MPIAGYATVNPPLYAAPSGSTSTSTTSLAIGIGTKVLNVQTNKNYSIGKTLKIYNSPNNYMVGDVVSYDAVGGVLTVNVTFATSSSTFAAWTISDTGPVGPQGIAGGSGIGNGGSTSSTDVTLSPSNSCVVVSPSTPGCYATLPDATTLVSKGVPEFSIYNASEFDYGIKDNAGNKIGWVRGGSGAVIGCADNSTATGIWATHGVEKVGITAQSYQATVNSTLTYQCQRYPLDATRTMLLYGGDSTTNTLYAIIYDSSLKAFGSPYLLFSNSLGNWNACPGPASTQVFVTTVVGTTLTAYVLSGTGSVVSIIGTQTSTLSAAAPGTMQTYSSVHVAQAGTSGNFVASYITDAANYNGKLRGFSVTSGGATITIGTELPLASSSNTIYAGAIYSVSNTQVMVSCSSSGFLYFTPYTVTGSVITAGTAVTLTLTTMTTVGSDNLKYLPMSASGRIPVLYVNSGLVYLSLISVSGTTATASTAVALNSAITSGSNVDVIAVSATRYATAAWVTTSLYVDVFNDVSGTLTKGTTLTTSYASAGPGAILYTDANTIRVAHANYYTSFDISTTTPFVNYLFRHTVSNFTSPQPCNRYGVRDPRVVFTASGIFHGLVNYDYSPNYTAKSISISKPTGLYKQANTSSVAGSTGETWFIGTGYIERIECAV